MAISQSKSDIRIDMSKTEVKSIIKRKIREDWQKQWEEDIKGRWLYRIQRKVGEIRGKIGRNRIEKRIITRLRLGHTGLNSTLRLMGKHETGRCDECGENETIEHVMYTCRRFQRQRTQLIRSLTKEKEKYCLTNILRKSIYDSSYRIMFRYLLATGLAKRI